MTMRRRWMLAVILLAVVAGASLGVHAQSSVTYERLLNAAKEPHNYLTYGGDYASTRYSTLTQITPANVKEPEPRVGVSSGSNRKLAADTHRGRRHHVPDATAERRRRAGCHNGPRILDLSLHERGRHCLLRRRTIAASPYSGRWFTWARSTATSWPST